MLRFLEIHQVRDLKAVDLRPLKAGHLTHFAILGSCFSPRHIHHVAKDLCKEVKELRCRDIVNPPRVAGRKDEPWVMVVVKEISVFLFLPDVREEMDIESRWFDPIPKEVWDNFHYYNNKKRRE